MANDIAANRGWTPRELARLIRVSPDKVCALIKSGELPAINTASARCGRPRFIVLPHHLAAWERGRQAARPTVPPKKRIRQTGQRDFYPD